MTMLDAMAARLRAGSPVSFRARGHSMEPLIADGDTVSIVPRNGAVKTDDIVLVTVHGNTYLHKVLAVSGDRVQIGNNKGHVNGWTHISKVWGVLGTLSWDVHST